MDPAGPKQQPSAKSLHQLSDEGVEIKIRGKTYTLSRLTLRDMAAFQQHIVSERYAMHCEHAAKLPPAVAAKVALQLLSAAMSDEDIDQELKKIERFPFLLARSLEKRHPELDVDAFDLSADEVVEFVKALTDLSFPASAAENPTRGESPIGEK